MQFYRLFFTTPLALLSVHLVFQTLNIAIWEGYENTTASCVSCAVFIPVPIQLQT